MNTNKIFLDDSAISGRLRSSWTPRSRTEQRGRPVTSWRRDYLVMIGQDVVRVPAKKHTVSNDPVNYGRQAVPISVTLDSPSKIKTTEVYQEHISHHPNQLTDNDTVLVNTGKYTPESTNMSMAAVSPGTSTLAKQFNLEATTTKNKKSKISGAFRKVTRNFTTVVATIIFIAGIYVVFDGYMANKQVKVQLKEVSAAVDNGSNTPEGLPSETPPGESIENYQVAADMPRFLEIPRLGVKSRVLRMGVNPEGAVQAPSNIFDSGWYDGSSKPGESGASFIDGHVSGFTQPGVFKTIKTLKSGDLLSIEMGDTTKYQYKVVNIESYPAAAVDMSKALAPVTSGKQGLNLMTCNGSFDNSTNEYKERLVVFTERI